jgi:hypothetical protein
MRHISIILFLLLTACASNPGANQAFGTTTTGGNAGSGGSAGATNGGGGGEVGGSNGGSGGEATDGGGGAGGSVEEFVFDCSDVAPNHLVMKIQAQFEPTNYIAADGWVSCPNGGCVPSTAWSAIHVGELKVKHTVLDLGEVSKGTKLETNWGVSVDGTIKKGAPNYAPNPVPESETDVNDHAVEIGTTYCLDYVCGLAKGLCCYGDKELVVANVSGFGQTNGANLACITE